MKHSLQVFLFAAATAVFFTGCGGGGGSSSGSNNSSSGTPSSSSSGGNSFNYSGMFTNLADNIIIPNYAEFNTRLSSSASSIGGWCDAIGSGDEDAALAAAQSSWRALMDQWQKAELHNVGPAASQAALLRNQIYSFDTHPLDTCRTDRAVVLAEDESFDIATWVYNSRGLDALEYMLYAENLEHTCTESNDQTNTWNERSEEDRKAARCAYAQVLLEDITTAATSIHQQWIADGGNYRDVFINSSDPEVILETVSDAVFYIEKADKDRKLGVPLGLHDDCAELVCPDAVESPYSQTSLENIKINLESFSDMYTGQTGLSFDDIIVAAGMTDTNDAFLSEIADARNFVDGMLDDDLTLAEQSQAILDSGDHSDCVNSQANPDSVRTAQACTLHGYLKRITDRLRTDFITIIGVDLPDSTQGDTD